jgi:recombinational DNA repair protein RecT
METEIVKRTNNEKISDQIKLYTPEEVGIIKATVAKGFNDLELAYFLNVSKVYGLNPFTKQIWGYKDIIVFAGRDGFLSKAQQDKRWNGIASDVIREGEKYEINIAMGQISHVKDVLSKAKIIGAYAICKPKNCEIATIEWADFDTYNKGYNVWKADPVAMIKKVAESHCLAKAYGISGLAIEEDFEFKNDVAITMDHEEKINQLMRFKAIELIRTSTGDEDYKEIMEAKVNDPAITQIEYENIMSELRLNQPKKY